MCSFGSLKAHFATWLSESFVTEVGLRGARNAGKLPVAGLLGLIDSAFKEAVSVPDVLCSAWEKTGLWPLNINNVKYSLCSCPIALPTEGMALGTIPDCMPTMHCCQALSGA